MQVVGHTLLGTNSILSTRLERVLAHFIGQCATGCVVLIGELIRSAIAGTTRYGGRAFE